MTWVFVGLGVVTAQIPRSAATSIHPHVTALQGALHQRMRSPLWFPRCPSLGEPGQCVQPPHVRLPRSER